MKAFLKAIAPDYNHYLDNKRFAEIVTGFNRTRAFRRDMEERRKRGEIVSYTSTIYPDRYMPNLEKIDVV